MIWLTLRRFRFELVTLALALAALGAWLLYSGLQLHTLFDVPYYGAVSVAYCAGQTPEPQPPSECFRIISAFLDQAQGGGPVSLLRGTLAFLIALVPMLVGALLGAPLLARDLERGTFRLVWSQSQTRAAWLRGSLIAATVATVALVGAITLAVMWWRAPLDTINGRFQGGFEMEGTAPLAYALFALALGVALGVIVRSSVPAIFLTLVGYYVARIPFGFLRARYLPPLSTTYDSSGAVPANGPHLRDWFLTDGFMDRAGRPVSADAINSICGSNDPTTPGNPTSACVHVHGWLYQVVWQPDSRFWAFQGIETAIFLALALALLAFTIWWVRTRLA